MGSINEVILEIKGDLPSSTNLKSFFINFFYNPRFRVLLNYRLGKYFANKHFFLFKQMGIHYRKRMVVKRNCDISYKSKIGKRLSLPHPIGVVIGDDVVIKDNVTIFQQVTLGSHGKKGEVFSYPVIEDNVKIYAGAKIIGGVRIGNNAIIGANTVVNIDVPANSTAVGIPCRILQKKNNF